VRGIEASGNLAVTYSVIIVVLPGAVAVAVTREAAGLRVQAIQVAAEEAAHAALASWLQGSETPIRSHSSGVWSRALACAKSRLPSCNACDVEMKSRVRISRACRTRFNLQRDRADEGDVDEVENFELFADVMFDVEAALRVVQKALTNYVTPKDLEVIVRWTDEDGVKRDVLLGPAAFRPADVWP